MHHLLREAASQRERDRVSYFRKPEKPPKDPPAVRPSSPRVPQTIEPAAKVVFGVDVRQLTGTTWTWVRANPALAEKPTVPRVPVTVEPRLLGCGLAIGGLLVGALALLVLFTLLSAGLRSERAKDACAGLHDPVLRRACER